MSKLIHKLGEKMNYLNMTNEELEYRVNNKDGEAICELGERYLYGKNGCSQNYAKAYQMFHKGEKMRISRAYIGLGEMYRTGTYMAKNEEIAKEYYQKAGVSYPDSDLTIHQSYKKVNFNSQDMVKNQNTLTAEDESDFQKSFSFSNIQNNRRLQVSQKESVYRENTSENNIKLMPNVENKNWKFKIINGKKWLFAGGAIVVAFLFIIVMLNMFGSSYKKCFDSRIECFNKRCDVSEYLDSQNKLTRNVAELADDFINYGRELEGEDKVDYIDKSNDKLYKTYDKIENALGSKVTLSYEIIKDKDIESDKLNYYKKEWKEQFSKFLNGYDDMVEEKKQIEKKYGQDKAKGYDELLDRYKKLCEEFKNANVSAATNVWYKLIFKGNTEYQKTYNEVFVKVDGEWMPLDSSKSYLTMDNIEKMIDDAKSDFD